MKKIIPFIAITLWTQMIPAQAVILLDNSFESAFSGANGTPNTGWFSFTNTDNARGGEALDGTGFFAAMAGLDGTDGGFLVSNSENDGASVYQTVSLTAGTTYRFTIALGTNSIPAIDRPDAKFGVVVFNSGFSNQEAGTFGTLAAGGDSFSDYSVEWTAASTGNFNVGLRNLGYVAGTGSITQSALFMDNARLEIIPEPSTFALVGLSVLAAMSRRRRPHR